MNALKWVMISSLAAAIVVAILWVPESLAQSLRTDVSGNSPISAAMTGDAFDGSRGRGFGPQGGFGGHGRGFFGKGGERASGMQDMINVVAEQLGMTADELMEALHSGQSVADLAAERGVELSVIEDALVAQFREAIDAKVADGYLTQEEADSMVAGMTEKVSGMLNKSFSDFGGHGRGFKGGAHGFDGAHGMGALINTVAEELGLNQEELFAGLKADKSIADLAAEQGVELAAVEAAIVGELETHLAEAVDAGKLSQMEADSMLALLTSEISIRLSQPFSEMRADNFGLKGFEFDKQGAPAFIADVAEALGMTQDELFAEVKAGKSVADLAAEKGVALETITDILVAPIAENLAERVKEGQISQSNADTLLEAARTRIGERLNSPFSGRGGFDGHDGVAPSGRVDS